MNAILNQCRDFIVKNQTTIMTVGACIGVPLTAGLTARATLHADRSIRRMRKINPNVSKFDIFKRVAPKYITPTLVGTMTIGCMIGSNNTHAKREAALTSAYILTDTAFREYKDHVVDAIGSRKHEKIEHDIVEQRVSDIPHNENITILTSKGDTLCFDTVFNQYFRSDIETLRRIQNDANEELHNHNWLSLNDLYYMIGLGPLDIGEYLGWDINGTGLIDFRFGSTLTKDGEPCITLSYDISPKYQYYYGDR